MSIHPKSPRLRHIIGLLLLTCTCLIHVAAKAQDPVPTPPAGAASGLELLVLGSGGPGATGRAGASYVVLVDGVARVLVDAGPGAFARLGEAGVPLRQANIILLTHLHIDHVGGLPGLLKARAVSERGPIKLQIVGPGSRRASSADESNFPGTRQFTELLFGKHGAFPYLKDFSAPLRWQATDIPAPATPTTAPHLLTLHDAAGLRITATAGHHRDAPAVIYRVDHAGKSITFSGDIDATGLPALQHIAQGSSLLVFNSVVLDPPGSPEILYGLHTPPLAIGKLARATGVNQLLLSHLSPYLDQHRAEVLAAVSGGYDGTVTFAADLMRIRP